MDRLAFLWAICAVLVVGFPSTGDAQTGSDIETESLFLISGADTLLTGANIESFIRGSGYLVLTTDGYFRWTSYVNHLRVGGRHVPPQTSLTNASFRLEYLGKIILEGTINSGYESKMTAGVQLFDSDTEYNRARLSLRYLRLEPDMPADPLDSNEFLEYFRKSGKLVDWQIDR